MTTRTQAFSPENQDKLLFWLVENYPVDQFFSVEREQVRQVLPDVPDDVINAMFRMFEDLQLISHLGISMYHYDFVLLWRAVQLARNGGFRAKQKILEMELAKLENQVRALQKTMPERVGGILDALSKISEILRFMFGA